MRTKTVKRHYCDYCSKGMFRVADMTRHELGCTMNPNRTCYLCGNNLASSEDLSTLAAKLKEEYKDSETMTVTGEDLKRIRDAAADCPSCILSVLRQAKLYAFDMFDYKAELSEWHKAHTIEQYGSLGMTC